MAHVIGYVGEVSETDLNNSKYAFYSPGDVVGKSGIEEAYDEILRGTDGSRDVIVNSRGKEVGMMGQELAIPGKDLRITIDLDLQKAAERALEGKTGAIVAMDPHTGEILAMASRPTFDPNQFSVRLSHAYWQSIITNPDHPLMNKAIQAQLAPGSTFKVIMTLAGLQENVAQDMHVMCNGGADLLRPLLRMRQTSRFGRHPQRSAVLLRHLLLHAGQQTRHRHDRTLRRPGRHRRTRPASIFPMKRAA